LYQNNYMVASYGGFNPIPAKEQSLTTTYWARMRGDLSFDSFRPWIDSGNLIKYTSRRWKQIHILIITATCRVQF
jgi:hypothetical protein